MTDEPVPTRYPTEWESDIVLADGSVAHVRPIRPDDAAAITALHARLSPETIYYRFFSPLPRLSDRQLHRFTNVDYLDRLALVALVGDRIIGVARYDRLPDPAEAEAAFVVEDEWQGRGVGSLLLEHLAAAARANGIARLVAETLADNRRMLGVFRDAGFVRQTSFSDGVSRVVLDVEPTPASQEVMAAREARAARRSIQRLLQPRSVAVIGASRRPGTIGHAVFRNLLGGGFTGPVYPVHPTADHVASVRAYRSVLDVPDEVDLAVVVVPAEGVLAVVEECGAKGVRALVVISAGFAEAGPAGAELQHRLVQQARTRGMRVVGPNCMGVVNANPSVGLNATFAPIQPRFGRVAFSSQSGALGIAILDQADRLGLGISTFVSVGNKADVSGNDLVQYWEDDPDTAVILLYLESFGNPRKFSRIARRVSRAKPIVAVKAGRTRAGAAAAQSHTAAAASPDPAVDALFHQTGVIRVDTLEQMFDVSKVLAHQPLPAGRRVGIVSNAGGPGILAADTCEAVGLEVPALSAATRQRLTAALGPSPGWSNPLDLQASVGSDPYRIALEAVLADDTIDSVLAVWVPPLADETEAVARCIVDAAAASAKPVVANFLALGGDSGAVGPTGRQVPVFAYPESAVHALVRVVRYAEWRRRPEGTLLPAPDAINGVREWVQSVVADSRGGRWLEPDDAARLLSAAGISLAGARPQNHHPASVGVAVVPDPSFGPLLRLRAGGRRSDDRFRVLPLTDVDALELVGEAADGALASADRPAVAHLLQRVSTLADEVPEIAELHLEHVTTDAGRAVVGQAQIRLAPPDVWPDLLVRRLR